MDRDLKTIDFNFLKEIRMVQFTNLVTLQLTKNPQDAGKITAIEEFVDKIDAEIKRRNLEDEKGKKPNISTESSAKDFTSHKIKGMSMVEVFPVDPAKWVFF